MYQVEILFKSGVTKKFQCRSFDVRMDEYGKPTYQWHTDDWHSLHFDPEDVSYAQAVPLDPEDLPRPRRRPTRPGVMLIEEFLKPRGQSIADFAEASGISYAKLDGFITQGTIGVDSELATKLSAALGTTGQLWLNLQHNWETR